MSKEPLSLDDQEYLAAMERFIKTTELVAKGCQNRIEYLTKEVEINSMQLQCEYANLAAENARLEGAKKSVENLLNSTENHE